MINKFNYCLMLLSMLLFACGGNNKDSNVTSPGNEKTPETKVLETGADLLQDKAPLKMLNMYLDGFHFYNGHLDQQMEAHHYCSKLNEDLTQCVMYDGNGEQAKLMGVEYIISDKLFMDLPEDEKKLWHSHVYEVKSGELIAPGIPEVAEHKLMEKIVSTYGKTIHTWHTDHELRLPIGIPQIMMGFTEDGQLKDSLISQRDKRMQVSTQDKRNQRQNIQATVIETGANAWEQGEVYQLKLEKEK